MAKRRRRFGSGAVKPGTTGIVIEDEVTPFAIIAATNFKREYDRAIRHVGFEVHDRAKRYLRNSEHRKPLSAIQEDRTIDRAESKGRRLRKKNYAGDLNRDGKSIERAIHFEHKKGSLTAIVGFSSNDARKRSGKYFQEGRNKTVTMAMKQHFFALAENARGRNRARLLAMASMPEGSIIRVPARPIFDPVNRLMARSIPRLLEKRMERNLGLLEDQAYQAILFNEVGVNDNIRAARREARRDRRRQAG